MDQDNKKRIVAKAAMSFIHDGVTLGVGTGSTVNFLIDMLPSIREHIVKVVSSSDATTKLLKELDFEVTPLNSVGELDVYIDGADEADKHGHLIKGGGGALTREKVLASAARKFVCIIDDSKQRAMLGKFPLPVEVLPMAEAIVSHKLVWMGGRPVLREGFVTDNGNHIFDVHDLPITNPLEMETRINQVPGVITVGLFAHRPADVMLIASDTGVRQVGS